MRMPLQQQVPQELWFWWTRLSVMTYMPWRSGNVAILGYWRRLAQTSSHACVADWSVRAWYSTAIRCDFTLATLTDEDYRAVVLGADCFDCRQQVRCRVADFQKFRGGALGGTGLLSI